MSALRDQALAVRRRALTLPFADRTRGREKHGHVTVPPAARPAIPSHRCDLHHSSCHSTDTQYCLSFTRSRPDLARLPSHSLTFLLIPLFSDLFSGPDYASYKYLHVSTKPGSLSDTTFSYSLRVGLDSLVFPTASTRPRRSTLASSRRRTGFPHIF